MNNTGNQVIAGVIVVLLIIGAWYLGYKNGSWGSMMSSTATSSEMTSSSSTSGGMNDMTGAVKAPTTVANGDSVKVGNQPAGSMVSVGSVTLSEAGWVAVRDSGGRVLGAGYFAAGTNSNVLVDLLRNTESGQNYQVLLYIDDGDRQFDLHKDTLVTNADGSIAGTTFSALNGD